MLTKEEAYELKNHLFVINYKHHEHRKYVMDFVFNYIDIITEKPKREIQVGDIYQDGLGNFEYITTVNKKEITTVMLSSTGQFSRYLLEGLSARYQSDVNMDGSNPNDLDLSKRYNLVEVDG